MGSFETFYEDDADLLLILNKKVGVIGYGNQGRAIALNLRDRGVEVQIACTPERSSFAAIIEDKFNVAPLKETVEWADVILLLTSDDVMESVYLQIEPALRNGHFLGVAHGLNFHFNRIQVKSGVGLFLVAPKGPGRAVRQNYMADTGMPALVAIWDKNDVKTLQVALSLAKAMKFTKAGVLRTTFKEETETDLFGEQVVLCGGIPELVRLAFETLVDNGYSPEMAYLECLHEVKLIADLLQQVGVEGMYKRISRAALFGSAVAGPELVDGALREKMQGILSRIRNGDFVKDFLQAETRESILQKHHKRWVSHPIEVVGKQIRKNLNIGG